MTAAIRTLLFLGLFAALYFTASVCIPVIVALFLAVLLDPLVIWLEKIHIRRAFAAPIVTVSFFVLGGFAVFGIYQSVAEIAKEIPKYSEKIQGVVTNVQSKVERIERSTKKMLSKETGQNASGVQKVQMVEPFQRWPSFFARGISSIFEAVALGLFVVVILLFSLLEKVHLHRAFVAVMTKIGNASAMNREFSEMIRAFFLGNLIVGLSLAFIQGAVFYAMDLHNAIGLGLISGFLNLIPFVGFALALSLPFAQALLQFDSLSPFLVIGITVVALHFIFANFVIPPFIGSRVNLNTTVSCIALLFWGWLWGAIGFLIAIPLTAIVKIFLQAYPPTSELGDLLAAPRGSPSRLQRWLKLKRAA